jgi:hypothetical protein
MDVERHAAGGFNWQGYPPYAIVKGVGEFEQLVASGGVRPQPPEPVVELSERLVPSLQREVQHCQQAARSSDVFLRRRRCVAAEQVRQESEAFEIVDVEHSPDSAREPVVFGPGRAWIEVCHSSQARPAAPAPSVDVLEFYARFVKEGVERDVACLAELADQAAPVDPER